MAKGRQTKTIARVQLSAAVVDLHGKQFLQWSVTKPLDIKSEKLNMASSYFADPTSAMADLAAWLEANFPGAK